MADPGVVPSGTWKTYSLSEKTGGLSLVSSMVIVILAVEEWSGGAPSVAASTSEYVFVSS